MSEQAFFSSPCYKCCHWLSLASLSIQVHASLILQPLLSRGSSPFGPIISVPVISACLAAQASLRSSPMVSLLLSCDLTHRLLTSSQHTSTVWETAYIVSSRLWLHESGLKQSNDVLWMSIFSVFIRVPFNVLPRLELFCFSNEAWTKVRTWISGRVESLSR